MVKMILNMIKLFIRDRKLPDSLTIIDWLENLNDMLLETIQELRDDDVNSSKALAYFVVLSSTKSTCNILHKFPKSRVVINKLFLEFRLYYDCLWQLNLIGKCDADSQEKVSEPHTAIDLSAYDVLDQVTQHSSNLKKVSKLYGEVDYFIYGILAAFYEKNQHLQEVLCITNRGKYHNRQFRNSIITYIHGEGPLGLWPNDPLRTMCLVPIIDSILSEIGVHSDPVELAKLVTNDIYKLYSHRLLQDFDLNQCQVLDLPEDFYDKTGHEQ